MNDQYLKAPAMSVWALFVLLVFGMLQTLVGDGWSLPGSLFLMVAGTWAGLTIGRWAWSRYGSNLKIGSDR